MARTRVLRFPVLLAVLGLLAAANRAQAEGAPDLSIAKTDNQDFYIASQAITYTVAVTNTDAVANATGATVTDSFPAALTGVSWTCAATAGSTCTAAGAGNIGDTVDVLAGGTLTYTVTATVSAGATGTLVNTATVALAGDPNPANDSAADTDLAAADLNLDYFTVTPCRVMDTRGGAPIGGPALQGGVVRTVVIPPTCAVPATAVALSVNIVAVSPSSTGNIRIFPGGGTVPPVSSLNFTAGQTRANNAIVGLSPTGSLSIQLSQGTADFVIDVNGYFRLVVGI
jgi:uncharacterized repeat protein (TIGR01451 family)